MHLQPQIKKDLTNTNIRTTNNIIILIPDVDVAQFQIIKNVTRIKSNHPTCAQLCPISCHAISGSKYKWYRALSRKLKHTILLRPLK